MSLTPEECERIYEEERTRAEAQQQIAREKQGTEIKGKANCFMGGCAVLVFVSLLNGFLVSVRKSPQQDTTTTAINTPTAPPATSASLPSAKRTGMPRPHNITTPALVPTGPSPQIRAYLEDVSHITSDLESGLNGFNDENQRASETPTLIFTDDWKLRQAGNLAILTLYADQIINKKDVPNAAQPAHRTLVKMARELKAMCRQYAHGVDHADGSEIAAAGEKLNRVTELGQAAVPQIAALRDK